MGNSCATSSFSDDDEPDKRNHDTVDAFQVNEFPQVLYYSNVIMKEYDNVTTFDGYLEQRKVTIKRFRNNQAKMVKHETELLEKFDCHSNILRYFFKTHVNAFQYIISEHYETTLVPYFKDKVYLRIPIEKVMEDVSKGVHFLNGESIVHLNINPMNVVVACCQDRFIAKLANFTSALKLNGRRSVNISAIPGIDGFQAPELHSHKASITSDIYSMGCLFFYLISDGYKMQQVTFSGHEQIITSRLRIIKQDKSSSILCVDLITEMLRYEEMKRINTTLVLQHPFFFTTQQNLILILDAHKLIESKNETFRTLLYKNSRIVIGKTGDWKDKVEVAVLNILINIRKAHLSRLGTEVTDDQSKGNITNLITQIRNSVNL